MKKRPERDYSEAKKNKEEREDAQREQKVTASGGKNITLLSAGPEHWSVPRGSRNGTTKGGKLDFPKPLRGGNASERTTWYREDGGFTLKRGERTKVRENVLSRFSKLPGRGKVGNAVV